jgi:hypothetical protein
MESAEPSPRLIDQRLRNRIIEQLQILSRGDECVKWEGPEWVEGFFDYFPYDEGDRFRVNSAINPEECSVLQPVIRAMQDLIAMGAANLSEADFIASGWPKRIQPLAKAALGTLLTRGRFSEDFEQEEPSSQ